MIECIDRDLGVEDMQDDEKMLQFGIWGIGCVLLATVVLQVAFRTQNRQINRVRRQIVETQQQIAVAEAGFASLVRPEVLRNMVVGIAPKVEPISFNKSVSVNELAIKESL